MSSLSAPKTVLILVSRRYNSREFWPVLRLLHAAGITFRVVSTGLVLQDEETGTAHKIQDTVECLVGLHATDFDGMMVISGNPKDTEKYYKDKHAQRLVREMGEANKPLAAICAAVPALAPALRGKCVSWFPLQKSRDILQLAGAIMTEVGLTIDGMICTAENEWQTVRWAESFRDLVLGLEVPPLNLTPSGFKPKSIPRRYNPLEEALSRGTYVRPKLGEWLDDYEPDNKP